MRGIYIVRKDGWYAERTVWAVAGATLLAGTWLAWRVDPWWVLLVTGTGLFSLGTAFMGFCPIASVLLRAGFVPRLGGPVAGGLYRMRTDAWFLERGIYLVVGTTQTLGSLLVLAHDPRWLAFTGFVGTMSIAFAITGFCPVANVLWALGFPPRLAPPDTVGARGGPVPGTGLGCAVGSLSELQ